MMLYRKNTLSSWLYHKCKGRRLIWSTYLRVYFGGGGPRRRLDVKTRAKHYHEDWNMIGFQILFMSVALTFSFGRDVKGLYRRRPREEATQGH